MTSVILALFPCLLATTVVATEATEAPQLRLEDVDFAERGGRTLEFDCRRTEP